LINLTGFGAYYNNLKGNSLRRTFYVRVLGYCTHNCDYGRIAFDTAYPTETFGFKTEKQSDT